ncbi:MAG: DUF3800 domain-containing protein [Marinomonas sp.]
MRKEHDIPIIDGHNSFFKELLPNGGELVVLNAYFDESGTHDEANILVVAGYLFDSQQAYRFDRDWSKFLKKEGVPFAHMTDLANGNGHYKDVSDTQRVVHGRTLIENIKKRSRVGFAVAVDKKHYDERIDVAGLPTAATFCSLVCMEMVGEWLGSKGHSKQVAYVFEAGGPSQSEFSHVMDLICAGPHKESRYAYGSHAFAPKTSASPLQAADMLAWQLHHFHERCARGHKEPRKDYVALVRPEIDQLEVFVEERLDLIKGAAKRLGVI